MTEAFTDHDITIASVRPELRLVSDEQTQGRVMTEQYFALRQKVMEAEKPEDEALTAIQSATGEWAVEQSGLGVDKPFTYDDYAKPSYDTINTRFSALADFLRTNFPEQVSEDEIEASRLFFESSFALYKETPTNAEIHEDVDGSFAFVVPTRLSRQSTEYGEEVEPIMPILRYLPNNLRAGFAIGLPPLILDTYSREQNGNRGYLVLAPIWTDMMEDLADDLGAAADAAVERVNDAVDFAHNRLGAKVVGLGAVIPALTKFGQHIDNPNVITTTGHGGTIELIMNTIERAVDEGYVSERDLDAIGVLGLGSIGRSIAEITRDRYPNAEISVYDIRTEQTEKVARAIGGIVAKSEAEVIQSSNVIISAVTGHVDVEAKGLTRKDLEGTLIIDDSQPCSFTPEQVAKLGGTVAWVIGQNGIERSSYNFGGSMAHPTREVFGCEAEAATLAAEYHDLVDAGMPEDEVRARIKEVALREAVTPDKVRAIGSIFAKRGVAAAPLQAFGTYLR